MIANSGYYGIYMPAGQQIQFTRNSIFGNAKGGNRCGVRDERICWSARS